MKTASLPAQISVTFVITGSVKTGVTVIVLVFIAGASQPGALKLY